MNRLPGRWATARLEVLDAALADVPALCEVFNSCHYVQRFDPTFSLAADADLEALVRKSLSSAAPDAAFQMQCLRFTGQPPIIGYFHFFHDAPAPHSTWLSMLVIHRAHQLHHVGREVVEGACAELRGLGYASVGLRVYLKNWTALRFWIRLGFTSIRRFEGDPVLTEAGEASLVLERQIA